VELSCGSFGFTAPICCGTSDGPREIGPPDESAGCTTNSLYNKKGEGFSSRPSSGKSLWIRRYGGLDHRLVGGFVVLPLLLPLPVLPVPVVEPLFAPLFFLFFFFFAGAELASLFPCVL